LRREGWLEAIEQSTAQRLRDGEWDHLIHYALQSRAFTKLPPIEPALSALDFHNSGRIPRDAALRLDAFHASEPKAGRHAVLRRKTGSRAQLSSEYQRAMTFLYRKEWESKKLEGPERRDFVSRLYQTRGHSTDTSPEAAYALEIAMNILRGLRPAQRFERVLLAGPGLDWAPRTGLNEDGPPRSYQAETLRDSFRKRSLAGETSLRIDCVDVNPRVVDALQALGMNAYRMNILTQRLPPATYDLAVVTNVFPYFDDNELGLALSNLTYSLKPDAVLIHNELRPAAEDWGRRLGWPVLHARTHSVQGEPGLFDALVFHAATKR